MKPQRIQLRRTKGWRMPENTVKVDRATKWGNPLRIECDVADAFGVVSPIAVVDGSGKVAQTHFLTRRDAAAWAVAAFRSGVQTAVQFPQIARDADPEFYLIASNISKLRGKNLACWCPLDQPCHADVMLELANKGGD